jgi:ABC-type transport system involved in multi-copper enzyme maturation permease subunit
VAQDGKKLPFKALVMILEASGRIGGSRGERQLSEQGRADRDELNKILQEASAKPPEEQQKYLEAKLQQKLDRVKPEQLEGFIREQFAERGNLEVTSVKLLNQEGASGRYRFQVEARGRANTFNLWPHTLGLFFGATDTGVKLPIGPLVLLIESYAVGYAGAAIFLLVSSVMTSFFIPNMLRKGTVDLLISKPIRRWMLLLYKYVGGLLFMFLNTVVLIGGFWLVMGMRTGLWGPSFLLMIPILTFQFAIFYAVSTLAAVLTRNTIVAIMATAMFWAALFVAGQAFAWSGPSPGKEASTFHKGAKIVYKMLPRVRDMDKLSQYVIAVDLLQSDNKQRAELSAEVDNTSWAETVIVSVIFVALLLGASCWWFSSKDY